jgi:hypothetical protein
MENLNNEITAQEFEQEMPLGSIQTNYQKFKQPEWVFQFDDEEPTVFAWCTDPEEKAQVNLHLTGDTQCSVLFKSANGKQMKIFAREITEPTLKMISQDGNVEVEEN